MPRRIPLVLLVCFCATSFYAQRLADIEIHGFLTQGVLFSSNNNYLTMDSSDGSARWTDGAVSAAYSFSDKFRAGTQLHMYQLGELGGDHLQIDWASGDYKFNDHFGVRAGKVKTVLGLFNDGQDVDAIFLWILLPQAIYPIDNKGFFLAHLGLDVYGNLTAGRRLGTLQYHGYAGENNLDLRGGYVKNLANDGVTFRSAPGGKTYGGDLRWETPLRGLGVGSSADVQAIDGTAASGLRLHVAPLLISAQYAQFKRGKFYFAGEYRRLPFAANLMAGPQVLFSIPVDSRSWYAMGSYRLTKKLQMGSYYSHSINKAGDVALPVGYSKDRVISGRYDFNAYFYAKIEGHFLQGTGLGYYADTNQTGLRPNSSMLAAKIGFSF
jgi:hypothetical protein